MCTLLSTFFLLASRAARSRDQAVALRSATAPRARLFAKSRILARGISRLQRCLSAHVTLLRIIVISEEAPALLDLYSIYYYDAADYALKIQPTLLLSLWNGWLNAFANQSQSFRDGDVAEAVRYYYYDAAEYA